MPNAETHAAVARLWRDAGLPEAALAMLDLPGHDPVVPSSFAVAQAAQAGLAAAGLAAAELWHVSQGQGHPQRQRVAVSRTAAVLESCAHFTLDGKAPELWDKLSGLYACGADAGAPGWVRVHANFAHHRDIALRVLGCPEGPETPREAVAAALRHWHAEAFEDAVAQAGGVAAAVRHPQAWDRHPQAAAVAAEPLVRIDRIAGSNAAPRSARVNGPAPLHGLRVLDLTRILAGPVAGRTLAAYGADVLLVNSPHLPNISAIAETSRGKRSTWLDLRAAPDREALHALLREADVFLQGYRPGGLAALGLGPDEAAARSPGLVYVSLSAYGRTGPWAGRRGFDSLVQSATGFNVAEAEAAGSPQPRAFPLQILDYAAGYLLAFGAQAARWHQQHEGGSWHVQVSLAGVAHWLRGMGRVDGGLRTTAPDLDAHLQFEDSGFGRLGTMPHAVRFSQTPLGPMRPSMPPGSHAPTWA